ncbi:transcription factor LBX2 isoform X1 [Bos taurus]|uniref:transcription factor LBX2 isoform X1 n=1 Tax=Bos taurus TaxID=9913 RepID=UPI0028CB1578|nr:transcription factor LBX2 isoform X1 [Bos taurus]
MIRVLLQNPGWLGFCQLAAPTLTMVGPRHWCRPDLQVRSSRGSGRPQSPRPVLQTAARPQARWALARLAADDGSHARRSPRSRCWSWSGASSFRSTWRRPSATGWRLGSAWPTRRSSRGSRTGAPSSSATWRRCAPTWPRCARCPQKPSAASRCRTAPLASALAPPGLTLSSTFLTRRYRWTIEGKAASRALRR